VLDFKILRDLESRRSTLGRKIVNQLDEVAAETGEVSPERTKVAMKPAVYRFAFDAVEFDKRVDCHDKISPTLVRS
jgi:hypothetical protein